VPSRPGGRSSLPAGGTHHTETLPLSLFHAVLGLCRRTDAGVTRHTRYGQTHTYLDLFCTHANSNVNAECHKQCNWEAFVLLISQQYLTGSAATAAWKAGGSGARGGGSCTAAPRAPRSSSS